RTAIPACEVLRLERAKAERNFHAVEHHRHQPAFITRAPCFIAHEGRCGRTTRPHHDHGLRAAQFTLDDLRIILASGERAIPPDVEAALLKRFGKRAHPIAVLAGVGNEDVRHPHTPARTYALSRRPVTACPWAAF